MKKIIVTTSWDDGHILDMKLADVLRKYNLSGTFYIAPENREVPSDKRLQKGQVQTLAHEFEIGAHTMTHPRLSEIPNEVAREEIQGSKTTLEQWTEKPVTSFCYPGGDFTATHKTLVRDAGFSLARTVERFRTDIPADPFEMPTTIHAYRHWSDVSPIFHESGISHFYSYYRNWERLAMALFDRVVREGGVFHLWGHSWEIEKNGQWESLERVCDHISRRADVEYLTNQALI